MRGRAAVDGREARAVSHRFRTKLVHGTRMPYATWTFLIVPAAIAKSWGAGPKPVRGTVAGHPFRGTAARGEGAMRIPIPHGIREAAGCHAGQVVEATLEIDPDPRPVDVPEELAALLREDADLAARFDALPPSCRRAWAAHIGEAKRPETRLRRLRLAPRGIRSREFPR